MPQELLRDKWQPPTTFHHDHRGNVQYNCYRYQQAGDPYRPLLQYTQESGKVTVSMASIPAYMFGSSVVPVDDLTVPSVLSRLDEYLTTAGVTNYPPPRDWVVAKADVYHDFQVGDEVGNYIDALRRRNIARYKTCNIGTQTVFWTCGSRDIKMYDRHASCVDQHKDEATTHLSQGVIRLEVQIKAADVREATGDARLGDFYKSTVITSMLNKYMEKIGIDNLRITSEREIIELIQARFSPAKANRLMGYLRARQQRIEPQLHRTTIYRYDSDIKSLGIAPVIGIKRLSPLVIDTGIITAEKLAQFREYTADPQANRSII